MAEQPLFPAFQEFIHNNHLIERGEKIIVSVSGGIDSMVLLHLLCTLRERMQIELAIAHFNHQLRGLESDGDEAFVREKAKERSIECYVETANTEQAADNDKLSIQEVARNLRYEFLVKLRQSIGYHKIVTAHNADDNAETILFNLFRGTGIHGMTGIPIKRNDQLIIRPLLFATRARIAAYATEHGIYFREDSSNSTNKYTRNFIRHDLIPMIRENINPNLTAALNKAGELFFQLEAYIDSITIELIQTIVEKRSATELVLKRVEFEAQPIFLQEHILRTVSANFCQNDIDFNSTKTMMRIVGGETGGSCSITNEIVFYKNRDHLILRHATCVQPFSYTIEIGKSYEIGPYTFESSLEPTAKLVSDPDIEFVDADALGSSLILRSWNNGDWFIPFGANDRKKISDYFIDQKIPVFEKHSIPILTADDSVVWICGKRLDDRFKVTLQTKRFLKLHIVQGTS